MCGTIPRLQRSVLGVGLGNIGAPLSARIAAKFPTAVFDLDADAVHAHAATWGSTAVASDGLAAAAGSADVIFTCLPNTSATNAVVEAVRPSLVRVQPQHYIVVTAASFLE